MRRLSSAFLFLLIVFLVVLAWACIEGTGNATNFTARWNYDYTGITICSVTPVNCFDHFEVGLLSGSGAFQVLTVLNGTPPSSTIVNGITSPVFAINGFGQQTIAVIAVGKDGAGNRAASSPQTASVVVTVAPAAPTGLVVTSQ